MAKIPISKLLITISIYCCVFANGICSNIYGPTWLDLKSLMNTTLERMSLSISLRAAFFCAGAMIGGFIYKLIDRGALYPIFILIKGLCVALIPLYAKFHAFLVYSAIIGLVSGAADTSVNVWVIDIWKDKSAPFVQALQFFWAVGFIVSPLISNPFLSPDSKIAKQAALNSTNGSINSTNLSSNDPVSNEEHLIIIEESKLYIPYGVAGSICLIGSISLLVIYIYRKIEQITNSNLKNQEKYEKTEQIEKSETKKDEKTEDEFNSHDDVQFSNSKIYLVQILLFCCLMTSVFCASEMTTFQFVATFCVKLNLGLTKSYGAMVMTGVASSFAVGRFCGIIFALKFKPLYILWADWAFIVIGNLILVASNSGTTFLWIGSLMMSFGYSSFFAAIFSYLRERIAVNNFISSIVILSSLSGNAIGFPVFIGRYMESMPLMMVYGNLFCAFIMFICFIGLAILDCKYGIKSSIIKELKKNQANEMTDKLQIVENNC